MSPWLIFLLGAFAGGSTLLCMGLGAMAGRSYPEPPSLLPARREPTDLACHCDGCELAAQVYELRALPEAGQR